MSVTLDMTTPLVSSIFHFRDVQVSSGVTVRSLPGPMPADGWSPRVVSSCCASCWRWLERERELRAFYGTHFAVEDSA